MKVPFIPIILFFALLLTAACSNNDAQQEFESQAYQPAEGITQTDNNSTIIGDADPDDWRTSPFYSGLAVIQPIFPNPVPYGSSATLEVQLNGSSFTSILDLRFFDTFTNTWQQVEFRDDVSGDFSLTTMRIDPKFFGSNVEIARGTYRLVLFDGNQRIITYGDITIE